MQKLLIDVHGIFRDEYVNNKPRDEIFGAIRVHTPANKQFGILASEGLCKTL